MQHHGTLIIGFFKGGVVLNVIYVSGIRFFFLVYSFLFICSYLGTLITLKKALIFVQVDLCYFFEIV